MKLLSAPILSTIHLQKERSHVLRSEDCKVYLSASTCKFDILYMKSETAVLVQSCVYLQSPCMFVWRAPYRRRDMYNGPNLRPNLVQVRALVGAAFMGRHLPISVALSTHDHVYKSALANLIHLISKCGCLRWSGSSCMKTRHRGPNTGVYNFFFYRTRYAVMPQNYCVPECKKKVYVENGVNISFHTFPEERKLFMKWIVAFEEI